MAKVTGSSKATAQSQHISVTASNAASANVSASLSSGKRKKDDVSDNETHGGSKRPRKEILPAKANIPSGLRAEPMAKSLSVESKESSSTVKEPLKIRLEVVKSSGGEDDYEDACEQTFKDRMDQFEDDDEMYWELKQDLYAYQDGRMGIEHDDPELESIKYRMEYDIAVKTSAGENVGSVKLLVVDLSDGEFHDFWSAFEYHSSDMSGFLNLFAEEDRAYSYGYDGGHSEGPLLKVDVQSAGTKCWSRHEFTAYREDPLVYVLELVIEDQWRGRGIGSQVYKALGKLEHIRGAKYFFARPGPLDPMPPKGKDVKGWIERGRRIRAFHRQVGFRRIGNSLLYARAVDAKHPSRAIKPGEDAGYLPVKDMTAAQRKATIYAYA